MPLPSPQGEQPAQGLAEKPYVGAPALGRPRAPPRRNRTFSNVNPGAISTMSCSGAELSAGAMACITSLAGGKALGGKAG